MTATRCSAVASSPNARASAAIIKETVTEWFEQQLIEAVVGAQAQAEPEDSGLSAAGLVGVMVASVIVLLLVIGSPGLFQSPHRLGDHFHPGACGLQRQRHHLHWQLYDLCKEFIHLRLECFSVFWSVCGASQLGAVPCRDPVWELRLVGPVGKHLPRLLGAEHGIVVLKKMHIGQGLVDLLS